MNAPAMSREYRRTYVPPPAPKYERVTIWRKGNAVTSGGLGRLYVYPSAMTRILVRPFRCDPDTGEMRYSVSFYWENGAWSSVCFDSLDEKNKVIDGWAAVLRGWPTPEAI